MDTCLSILQIAAIIVVMLLIVLELPENIRLFRAGDYEAGEATVVSFATLAVLLVLLFVRIV